MRKYSPEPTPFYYHLFIGGARNLTCELVSSDGDYTRLEEFFRIMQNLKASRPLRHYGFFPGEKLSIDDLPVLPISGHKSQRILHASWESDDQGEQEMYFLEVTRNKQGESKRSWLSLFYLIASNDNQYPDDIRRLLCTHFSSMIARIEFLRGRSLVVNEAYEDWIMNKVKSSEFTLSFVDRHLFEKEIQWSINDFLPFTHFSDSISFLDYVGGLNKEIELSVKDNRRYGFLLSIMAIIRLIKSIDTKFDNYYTLSLKRNVIWKDARIRVDYSPESSHIAIEVGQSISCYLFDDLSLRDVINLLWVCFKKQHEYFEKMYPKMLLNFYDSRMKELAMNQQTDISLRFIFSSY